MLGHTKGGPWRADIQARLEKSEDFARTWRAFDGGVVFTVDTSSTWFKFYAGRVIDVVPGQGIFGFTFEIAATAAVWIDAFSASSVRLQRLLAERKVHANGNLLEFMRMANGVDVFIEVLAEQYRETRNTESSGAESSNIERRIAESDAGGDAGRIHAA